MSSSLTIRPFRNSDVPTLLELWRCTEYRGGNQQLGFLTQERVDSQVLGPGFFDLNAIMLAFEGDHPVGYVHATLSPRRDGSGFDATSGQICFMCVDPACQNPVEAAMGLVRTAENYLTRLGVREIFGGSPRPVAPFYLGFLSGGEPIAFFDRDQHLIQAFQQSGYHLHRKTTLFHYQLPESVDQLLMPTTDCPVDMQLQQTKSPQMKSWWEACCYAHFDCYETALILSAEEMRVTRVRIATDAPDTGHALGRSWKASLMDMAVHSRYRQQGLGTYVLYEALRNLVKKKNIFQIDAHISEDAPYVLSLLQTMQWRAVETGSIFRKEIR